MNLISILLIATAVLCLLTGSLSLVGSSKNERGHMSWFSRKHDFILMEMH